MALFEPIPRTDLLAEDSPEARLVGEYLDLVDQYGPSDPRVQSFLEAHRDNQALQEWSQVAKGLGVKGREALQRQRHFRVLGTVFAALFVLILSVGAVVGTQRSLRLAQVEPELAQAQAQLAQAETKLTHADTELAQAQTQLANMRTQYQQALAQLRSQPTKASTPAVLPPYEAAIARADLPPDPSLSLPPDESHVLVAE